jgi:hypothetical protein
MPYKVKSESFEIMSGPDEGKVYKRRQSYDAVPKGYEDRFEKLPEAPKPEKKKESAPETVSVPPFLRDAKTETKEAK